MKISEIFWSFEGEGIEIGKPEIFIRLAECNLRCDWCDTKYSWNPGREMSIDEIVTQAAGYPCNNASITGGEPLLQKEELLELVHRLKRSGYWIQLNTNGTIFDNKVFESVDLVTMDCKCPSSGMKSDLAVLKKVVSLFSAKSQFKFVISNEEDYHYTKEIISSLLSSAPNIVLQPQWKKRNVARKLAEFVIRDRLNARLILQQHKIIWGEKRGV